MEIELNQAYATFGRDLGATLSLVLVTLAGIVAIVWDSFRNNAREIPWITCGLRTNEMRESSTSQSQ